MLFIDKKIEFVKSNKRLMIASAVCGFCWGIIAILLTLEFVSKQYYMGYAFIIFSPLVGMLNAFLIPLWQRSSFYLRLVLSLIFLYLSVALLGMLYVAPGAIFFSSPGDAGLFESLLGTAVLFIVGTTVSGYFLLLWPLAYISYREMTNYINKS